AVLHQQEPLAGQQPRVPVVVLGQPRPRHLGADEVGAVLLSVLLEPVGVGQARQVVVGRVADGGEQRGFVGHGGPPVGYASLSLHDAAPAAVSTPRVDRRARPRDNPPQRPNAPGESEPPCHRPTIRRANRAASAISSWAPSWGAAAWASSTRPNRR